MAANDTYGALLAAGTIWLRVRAEDVPVIRSELRTRAAADRLKLKTSVRPDPQCDAKTRNVCIRLVSAPGGIARARRMSDVVRDLT
jgi:hypothetical protein